MRPLTLTISAVVHGSAIGLAVVTGAYAAHEARRAPRVEVVSLEARPKLPAPAPSEEPLPVEAEESELEPLLRPDPALLPEEFREPLLPDPVPAPAPTARDPELLLTRVVAPPPPAPAPEPLTSQLPPELSRPAEPARVEPQPAEVHVAASPIADNRPPDYPSHEWALGLEGRVVVGATVDRFGVVVGVRLIERSKHIGFNRAALAAVRRWRFEPATRGGVPIEEEVPLTILFQLEDAR